MTPSHEQQEPRPRALALGEDEVHVWRASLDANGETVEGFAALLSEDELRRAGRFHFRQDRDRFVVARAALRSLLGAYTGLRPRGLSFVYSRYGKPSVDGLGEAALHFNVSHSRGRALFAFTRLCPVGVDIEFVRDDINALEIAKSVFSGREVAQLLSLPGERRVRAFYDCWTRKEAFIKASGEGFSFPTASFSVSCAPGEPPALLDLDAAHGRADEWSIAELAAARGYAAAVALRRGDWRLSLRDWEDLRRA